MGLLLEALEPELIEAVKMGLLTLTPAEYRVLRLWSGGMGAKSIAARLDCSHRTVEVHLARIRWKCGRYDWKPVVRALCALDTDEQVAGYLVGLNRH